MVEAEILVAVSRAVAGPWISNGTSRGTSATTVRLGERASVGRITKAQGVANVTQELFAAQALEARDLVLDEPGRHVAHGRTSQSR